MKQRVARGKEAIDARLDLHGLTQAQAHADAVAFPAQCQRARRAAGAGDHRQRRAAGERGVLRRQVPQWLGLPEFRAW